MPKKVNIGGQAVIEGVMIRGPKYNVVAVRKGKKIITKKEKLKLRKGKFYKLHVVRGFFNLIDMLVIGFRSIMWSAEQQLEAEKEEKISKKEIAFTIILAVLFGVGIFIILPYIVTNLIGFYEETNSLLFNLIDGLIRIVMFLLYIYGISLMKDVRILFQYHGAEHKAVHCYENNEKLEIKNMKKYSTLHARCGTAFLMFVLVIAILTFSIITPIILMIFPQLLNLNAILRKIILILIRLSLLPLIAGISYEFLKFSAKYEKNKIMRLFVWPGLLMQKITTKKPNNKQIEVAIVAVKNILQLEKGKGI